MKKLFLMISLITIALSGCYVRGYDEGYHRDHDRHHHEHDRDHDDHDNHDHDDDHRYY